MTLVGQSVQHKTLGAGMIEGENGKYLTIRFGSSQKTFVYPDAFAAFLTAADPSLAEQAQADLAAERAEREKRLARIQEEAKYIKISGSRVLSGDPESHKREESYLPTDDSSDDL